MNTQFETTDITLAAYLICKGHHLKTIEVVGRRGTFVLDAVDPAEVTTYDTQNGLVEPIQFNQQIRQLTTAVRRIADSTGRQ